MSSFIDQNSDSAAPRPAARLVPAEPVTSDMLSHYVREGERMRARAIGEMFAALGRAFRRGRDKAASGGAVTGNGVPAQG